MLRRLINCRIITTIIIITIMLMSLCCFSVAMVDYISLFYCNGYSILRATIAGPQFLQYARHGRARIYDWGPGSSTANCYRFYASAAA